MKGHTDSTLTTVSSSDGHSFKKMNLNTSGQRDYEGEVRVIEMHIK